MRNRVFGFAVLFAAIFALLALLTHPGRFVDWLFYVGVAIVFALVLMAPTWPSAWLRWRGAVGGPRVLPRGKLKRPDRPDEYDYPDSGL